MRKLTLLGLAACLVAMGLMAPVALAKKKKGPALPSPLGPCTKAAAASMPEGEGHDHLDVTQHQFSCGFEQVFFDGLADELADEPTVVLGEMDVAEDLLAVGVALPESGVLFFDVSDPANPEFLSWYRGSKCEALVFDFDCGAYVDLSEDGQVAFLSVQSLTVVPQSPPDPGVRPVPEPGVEVIDVSNPSQPLLTQVYPVPSESGVHTSRSHVIPGVGEFLFSVANGFGVLVSEVDRTGGVPKLLPVQLIQFDEVHDVFLMEDPLDERTYLYVPAGFESGFYVYDVTDPAQEELLAEWDITPQCPDDWYSHTVYTVVRGGRRYVTMPAELFDFGSQSGPPDECGQVLGNGDKPGPLWIVDATDLSKLGPAVAQGDDDIEALKESSEAALVTTWTNPAGRAAGILTFSPHNQQVVGNNIYLSHYHGGVYLLDASAAFRGIDERPRELAVVVPHGDETRPIFEHLRQPVAPFFSTFPPARSEIWDMVYYKGHVLAADMYGGVYSFRYAPTVIVCRARLRGGAPGRC
jgi:hypothetical protein